METAQEPFDSLDMVDSMNSVEVDTERDVVRARYDSKRDPPCLAVLAVVATVDDTDVVDLAPLESVIDTDALEILVSEAPTGAHRYIEITFTYEGYGVTISDRGLIEVRRLDLD